MGLRSFLTGVGLGYALAKAVAMSTRQRPSVRETALELVDAIGDLPERAADLGRRVRDQAADLAYEAWRRLEGGALPDEILAARVRAEVAHVALRPDHLTILADRGNVTLTGWASPEEFERLIEAVRGVKGVERVAVQLDAFGSSAPKTAYEPREATGALPEEVMGREFRGGSPS